MPKFLKIVYKMSEKETVKDIENTEAEAVENKLENETADSKSSADEKSRRAIFGGSVKSGTSKRKR